SESGKLHALVHECDHFRSFSRDGRALGRHTVCRVRIDDGRAVHRCTDHLPGDEGSQPGGNGAPHMKACNSHLFSRREFAAFGAFGITGIGMAQSMPLTAGQVVNRIKQHLGVPWHGGPTDTFKSGGEESKVTGIATTVMSTFDVIKRAAATGKNMVITHEPTFWLGNDDVR